MHIQWWVLLVVVSLLFMVCFLVQVPPEAGSSRHSSVSELPSSPLTEPLQPLGMGDEEVEEEGALSKGKKLSKLSNRSE